VFSLFGEIVSQEGIESRGKGRGKSKKAKVKRQKGKGKREKGCGFWGFIKGEAESRGRGQC